MEHALHLAAKHFVEEVAPTSASVLHAKAAGDDEDEEEVVEEEEDFNVADAIGKALALVTQVSGCLFTSYAMAWVLTPFVDTQVSPSTCLLSKVLR